MMWRRAILLSLAIVLGAAVPRSLAGERYAVVITGASGSPQYSATHAKHRQALVSALLGPLGLSKDHVAVLIEDPKSPDAATKENVTRVVSSLAGRLAPEDLMLVVLIGHGTDDGVDAKFNLVGPDMSASDWKTLLQNLRARLIFVDTTAASASFLPRLAGPNRIVITATDTPAQQYDTVFAEFFGGAFTAPDADLDKDGRVSIGEAFAFASARVKRFYGERGQLATERAVLDDSGDGRGKQAGTPGDDGSLASRTFLDAGSLIAASGDTALSELLARRDVLETQLDELKRKKEFMPADDYSRELERLLVDLARLSRQIRSRS